MIFFFLYFVFLDRDSDGYPDEAELWNEEEISLFRERMRGFIIHALKEQPEEIKDCASLLRYAYRMAMKPNKEVGEIFKNTLGYVPEDLRSFKYPQIPYIREKLFRIREGKWDGDTDAFSSFADLYNLSHYSMRFISREVEEAKTGDVIIFSDKRGIIHSMILVDIHGKKNLIYHTGGKAGIFRIVELEEFMNFPDKRWRISSGNRYFTGVFRWKIINDGG